MITGHAWKLHIPVTSKVTNILATRDMIGLKVDPLVPGEPEREGETILEEIFHH